MRKEKNTEGSVLESPSSSTHQGTQCAQEDNCAIPAARAAGSEGNSVDTTSEGLQTALEYLLIAGLNMRTPALSGAASNQTLVTLFFELLLSLQPRYFLDIGANDASTAVRVKRFLPESEVWAFEANPVIYEHFVPAIAGAGVRYTNLAISDQNGEVTIYVPRTLSRAMVNGELIEHRSVEPAYAGKSSLRKRNEDATYQEFQVQSITLDQFLLLRNINPPTRDMALWIDVEGAAYEVLSGAGAALAKASVVFIESENYAFWDGQKQAGDVARLLIRAGFVPVQRDREYGDKQFNTVFLHYSLVERLYPREYSLQRSGAGELRQAINNQVAKKGSTRNFTTLSASLLSKTPVLVPVFNNPTYAGNMLRQLRWLGFEDVILLDNSSTSAEMLSFLDSVQGQSKVIRTGRNDGPRSSVLNSFSLNLLPEIFCVTDPDLEFNERMPEDFLAALLHLSDKFKIGKVGLALRIDDAAEMRDTRIHINGQTLLAMEWEAQFWRTQVDTLPCGSPVFRAAVDTTFALYNKRFFSPHSFFDALRVAGSYSCRHLPWYKDNGLSKNEELLYEATQKFSFHLTNAAGARPDTTSSTS